jgi:hypothetical protein
MAVPVPGAGEMIDFVAGPMGITVEIIFAKNADEKVELLNI